jgi:uncharacterized membrane protein
MNFSFTWAGARNYAIALVIFLAIDMVWLMLIAKSLYAQHLGYLMAPKAKLLVAFLFYLLFVVGLQFFVLNPALASGSWKTALFAGMFFGLVTYATYDLTNLATVKDWPVLITAIDLVWGSFVSGVTALLSFLVIKKFF